VIWGLWSFDSTVSNWTLQNAMRRRCDSLAGGEQWDVHFSLLPYERFQLFYLGDFLRSRAYFEEALENPAAVMGAFHPRVGRCSVSLEY